MWRKSTSWKSAMGSLRGAWGRGGKPTPRLPNREAAERADMEQAAPATERRRALSSQPGGGMIRRRWPRGVGCLAFSISFSFLFELGDLVLGGDALHVALRGDLQRVEEGLDTLLVLLGDVLAQVVQALVGPWSACAVPSEASWCASRSRLRDLVFRRPSRNALADLGLDALLHVPAVRVELLLELCGDRVRRAASGRGSPRPRCSVEGVAEAIDRRR